MTRTAYAIEQMRQFILTHDDLEFGYERLKRVPGAGNWDSSCGNYIFGLDFAPKGFKKLIEDDMMTRWLL